MIRGRKNFFQLICKIFPRKRNVTSGIGCFHNMSFPSPVCPNKNIYSGGKINIKTFERRKIFQMNFRKHDELLKVVSVCRNFNSFSSFSNSLCQRAMYLARSSSFSRSQIHQLCSGHHIRFAAFSDFSKYQQKSSELFLLTDTEQSKIVSGFEITKQLFNSSGTTGHFLPNQIIQLIN